MKSGNLKFLEPSGPLQACNGTARFTFLLEGPELDEGQQVFCLNYSLGVFVLFRVMFVGICGTSDNDHEYFFQ
jgi:hypothetical protein